MDPRYLRQVLLAEIGVEGQARIARASAPVLGPPGTGPEGAALAHRVAEAYARGAGFGALEPGPIDVGALAPEAIAARPASRAVLAGARAALAAMRAALAPARAPEAAGGRAP